MSGLPRRRNDQVFQLSLTELAFAVAFLLMLLLGWKVVDEERARREAEDALAKAQRAGSVEQATRALDAARTALVQEMRGAGGADPDGAISRLVAGVEARAERDRLKARVEDLEARLSALAELQRRLQAAASAPGDGGDGGAGDVVEALAVARAVREEARARLGHAPASGAGGAVQAVKELAAAGERDRDDLRGQVAFLKNRLAARGGRDYPPCWADADGKVQFLFAVEMRPDGLGLAPAWPASREAEARAIPGVADLLAHPVGYADFAARTHPVLDWSKRRDPECRHYVQLRSTLTDAVREDRARWLVEDVFYKVEARR